MSKLLIVFLLSVYACASAQRITTIHLDGVQYFISRMNPYSPELNYFLAYQYCRSLGLQLASFETKEKADSMATYLQNAGYSNYDFWTSGNRLGTGMFLWMSTGLPFNATFDFFENSTDAVAGLLDPVDHNSNTSPQRTARDSTSGADKACVMLKQPSLKWMPEDCSVIKDFICEQTRCYYYNYGSIPVSSAQGRPIKATTAVSGSGGGAALMNFFSTTAQPATARSTLAHAHAQPQPQSAVAAAAAFVPFSAPPQQQRLGAAAEESQEYYDGDQLNVATSNSISAHNNNEEEQQQQARDFNEADDNDHAAAAAAVALSLAGEGSAALEAGKMHQLQYSSINADGETPEKVAVAAQQQTKRIDNVDTGEDDAVAAAAAELILSKSNSNNNNNDDDDDDGGELEVSSAGDETSKSHEMQAGVEVRLRQISELTKKQESALQHGLGVGGGYGSNSHNNDDLNRQSFLSLTDLIRTLRPNDKQIIPQIDSDYSNAMRGVVRLGENTAALAN